MLINLTKIMGVKFIFTTLARTAYVLHALINDTTYMRDYTIANGGLCAPIRTQALYFLYIREGLYYYIIAQQVSAVYDDDPKYDIYLLEGFEGLVELARIVDCVRCVTNNPLSLMRAIETLTYHLDDAYYKQYLALLSGDD